MKLEESMKKLDEIAKSLNSGEKSLDESLKLYEAGVKLARQCLDELEQTKGKITEIKEGKTEENL